MLEAFEATGNVPTNQAVCDALDLSMATVSKYRQDFKADFGKIAQQYQVFTPKVIEATLKSATDLENGSSADRKLWFQIIEGRMGGDEVDKSDGITLNIVSTSDVNVQVNNN